MVWHRTIGDGPAKVVVIHGWFWDHRVFAPVFDCLDGDRFTFAFLDIRGYGRSDKPATPFSLKEMADDVLGVCRDEGVNEAILGGVSVGSGMAALCSAARHRG